MLNSSLSLAEKYDYLSEKFRLGYKWLMEADINALSDGKYKIDGDDITANVQTYTTQPAGERRYEAHDKFFDIQYIAEGEEAFGVCPREGLTVTEAHPERDVFYYADPAGNSTTIILKAGDLVVVAPEEAHKPCCCVGSPSRVRKIVVKVRV
ncbi:MAG: YhcH/YjgK/YiaL family protein [Synergistaceae bacterium]|nr:YhcH/YjgK/YiaL family protein [Synergistaceae bacterium]